MGGSYPTMGYPITGCTVACVTRSPHAPAYRKLRAALATARTEAGLTQAEVAAKLKRPQSFVSKYESGERSLDVVEFIAVCRALKVAPSMLIEQLAS